jgi:hypothetical protein
VCDSKVKKLVLAALTAWPIIYMVAFFVFVFGGILMTSHGHKPGAEAGAGMPPFMMYLIVFHCGTILEIMALAVYYIIHCIKNAALKQDMRIIWVILLIMGGIIAMPIYWYLYIWPSTPTDHEKSESSECNAL